MARSNFVSLAYILLLYVKHDAGLVYFTCSEHGANHYEVGAQTQMRSQVPWLSVVLKILQDTQQLLQDLIDKVYIMCTCVIH